MRTYQPIAQRRACFSACLSVVLLLWIGPQDAHSREWLSADGKHRIEAELVHVDGENVTLRRADGSQQTARIDVFSQRDRDYLKQQAEAASGVTETPQGPLAAPARTSPEPAEPEGRRQPDSLLGSTTASPTANPDQSESDDADDSSGADFVEIVYQGRVVRVPKHEIAKVAIELDGDDIDVKIAPQRDVKEPNATIDRSEQDRAPGIATADVPTSTADLSRESGTATAPGSTSMFAAVIMLSLGVFGLLSYYMLVEPLRKQRPLRKAVAIIRDEQRPLYQEAEDLLNQSLLAGLRRKDVAVARFSLAHLRSLLGKHEEAATVLADLEKSGAKVDRPTAYLMLWVQSKVGNHERVERIYNEYLKQLQGYQQSELIVSVSYLRLAFLRLSRREIGGALHYFEQVRQLDVLADEIPSHLDDYEVVSGVVALFEKNIDEAAKHFQAAVESATKKDKPTHPGRLGLLLCQWRREQLPDIDEALTDILSEMKPRSSGTEGPPIRAKCPHCEQLYSLTARYRGKKVQCKKVECKRRFTVVPLEASSQTNTEERPAEISTDRLFSESDALLRNTLLWHCVTLLIDWLRRKEKSGLQKADRLSIRRRLKEVTDLDPECGDAFLIGGMIDYYFAESDEDRAAGREQIEKAVDLEVHVPEVIQLLDRMNKLAALAENSLAYFHQLSTQYATNAEVDPQLRARFVRMMQRYSRFRELGEIESFSHDESIAPSLENLQGRGQILRNRVSNIVRFNADKEGFHARDSIIERLDDLDQQSQSLAQGAEAFQQTELQLMESTGEFLFNDEEPDESAGSAS